MSAVRRSSTPITYSNDGGVLHDESELLIFLLRMREDLRMDSTCCCTTLLTSSLLLSSLHSESCLDLGLAAAAAAAALVCLGVAAAAALERLEMYSSSLLIQSSSLLHWESCLALLRLVRLEFAAAAAAARASLSHSSLP